MQQMTITIKVAGPVLGRYCRRQILARLYVLGAVVVYWIVQVRFQKDAQGKWIIVGVSVGESGRQANEHDHYKDNRIITRWCW